MRLSAFASESWFSVTHRIRVQSVSMGIGFTFPGDEVRMKLFLALLCRTGVNLVRNVRAFQVTVGLACRELLHHRVIDLLIEDSQIHCSQQPELCGVWIRARVRGPHPRPQNFIFRSESRNTLRPKPQTFNLLDLEVFKPVRI